MSRISPASLETTVRTATRLKLLPRLGFLGWEPFFPEPSEFSSENELALFDADSEELEVGFEESDVDLEKSDVEFEKSDVELEEFDVGFEESEVGFEESDVEFEEFDVEESLGRSDFELEIEAELSSSKFSQGVSTRSG